MFMHRGLSLLRRPAAATCSTAAATGRGVRTKGETIASTSIRVIRSVDDMRTWRRPQTLNHRSVGFVPTMGALHQGHLALVREAARQTHEVVVSMYVNPAQFGAREDLSSYPVTWDADVQALARLDHDLAQDGANLGRLAVVFAPTTSEMYPSGFPGQDVDSKGSFVSITPLAEVLEGASRPTFFRGVATVCMKLFNIIQPDRVFVGQKDVQQSVILRRMLRDFAMPIELVVCPTQRDPDGLALSSRNVYLGPRRRRVALALNRALRAAETAYQSGHYDRAHLLTAAQDTCNDVLRAQRALNPAQRALFDIDYISLADLDNLQEINTVDPSQGAVMSAAIKMPPLEQVQPGEDVGHADGPHVRLIDNVLLDATKAA